MDRNLFALEDMADGYALWRPPVHPLILRECQAALGQSGPVGRALDIGCGSGLSTRALAPYADRVTGIEPGFSMLLRAASAAQAGAAPVPRFAAAEAEHLPFPASTFELITAAGSLNYCEPRLAFPELLRVLRPGGILVVYDFFPGRRMQGSSALGDWYSAFLERYPQPPDHALTLDPERLAALAAGFGRGPHARFEAALPMDLPSYLNYVLTETNVARALQHGESLANIREWCGQTLGPVFMDGSRKVLFEGYWASFLNTGV